jgi:hypothetical protein
MGQVFTSQRTSDRLQANANGRALRRIRCNRAHVDDELASTENPQWHCYWHRLFALELSLEC